VPPLRKQRRRSKNQTHWSNGLDPSISPILQVQRQIVRVIPERRISRFSAG
jgi:hypothetical protein